MKTTRLLMVVVLCLAVSVAAFARIATGAGGGSKATRYLLLNAAGDTVETTAPPEKPEDIPGLGGVIQVGGRVPTCITAALSGEFYNYSTPAFLLLRALVDGGLMEGHSTQGAFPGFVRSATANYETLPRSFTFWACGVTPGPHTVQVQWATYGAAWIVGGRTLIVEGR